MIDIHEIKALLKALNFKDLILLLTLLFFSFFLPGCFLKTLYPSIFYLYFNVKFNFGPFF